MAASTKSFLREGVHTKRSVYGKIELNLLMTLLPQLYMLGENNHVDLLCASKQTNFLALNFALLK